MVYQCIRSIFIGLFETVALLLTEITIQMGWPSNKNEADMIVYYTIISINTINLEAFFFFYKIDDIEHPL